MRAVASAPAAVEAEPLRPAHPVTGLIRSSRASVLRDEVATRVTPHEVTASTSRLDGAVGVVDLPTTRLVFVRYGGDVVVEAPATDDRVVATVPLGPMGVRRGAAAESVNDSAFILERSDSTLMRPDPWAGALVLATDQDRLRAHRDLIFGEASVLPVASPSVLARSCRSSWHSLASLPESTPAPVLESFLSVVEEHLLTGLVLATVAESAAFPADRPDARLGALREWLDANHGVEIGVVEMAQAVGLSVRQLQSVVRSGADTTPTELLRRTRLLHAHQRLLSADPTSTTVAAIAHISGYAHLGRFSVQYREHYGEAPSQTLRGRSRP